MHQSLKTIDHCHARLFDVITQLTVLGRIEWVRQDGFARGLPYEHTLWAGTYNGWALHYRRYRGRISWPTLFVEGPHGTMYEAGLRCITDLDIAVDYHCEPGDIEPALPSAHIVYGDWCQRPLNEWREVVALYEQSSAADRA